MSLKPVYSISIFHLEYVYVNAIVVLFDCLNLVYS
jgi:hypothetical protein